MSPVRQAPQYHCLEEAPEFQLGVGVLLFLIILKFDGIMCQEEERRPPHLDMLPELWGVPMGEDGVINAMRLAVHEECLSESPNRLAESSAKELLGLIKEDQPEDASAALHAHQKLFHGMMHAQKLLVFFERDLLGKNEVKDHRFNVDEEDVACI
mmetsp:Transcript_78098/g.137590  ORF Transcript_78098/g.137590 Transcript_78098/m.137590 type:complete len:155 (+) Transcript_78098:5056-5520(+)